MRRVEIEPSPIWPLNPANSAACVQNNILGGSRVMHDRKVLPDMTGVRTDSTISLTQFDPLKEMDILRRVVRRDALVALLADQRRSFMSGGALCIRTVLNALLEIREASLDVIDAITRWRLTLIKPEAFIVRGTNYAITMTTDIGFLATGLTPVKEAFGIELGTGNTFALPCAAGHAGATARAVTRRAGKGEGCGNHTPERGGAETGRIAQKTDKAAAAGAPAGPCGAPQNTGIAGKDPARSPGAKGSSGKGVISEEAQRETTSRLRTALVPGKNNNNNNNNNNGGSSSPDASTSKVSKASSGHQISTISSADEPRVFGGIGEGDSTQTPEELGREKAEGDRATMREVLLTLGDVDAEQRVRLARAQLFLEQEVARGNGKPREALWWGFHRWTIRPWIPGDALSLAGI